MRFWKKLLILLLLQALQEKLDSAVDLEMGLREELNKYREENEDLRFQVSTRVKINIKLGSYIFL